MDRSLPQQNDPSPEYSWDLSTFYPSIAHWKKHLEELTSRAPSIESYRGTLDQSAARLAAAVSLCLDLSKNVEQVYTYAQLRSDLDTANSENYAYLQQALHVYTQILSLCSFVTPELLSLPKELLERYLESVELKPFRRMVREILRFRPHTLAASEEQLLALGAEVFAASEKIYSQLHNADFTFGTVRVDGNDVPLTHGSLIVLLKHQNRAVRVEAFQQYYQTFETHKHGLSAALTASVQKDVYLSKVKKYPSSLVRGLFADDVNTKVYQNLIDTVSSQLKPLHRYYELRKRSLKLPELRLYDTYVPLVREVQMKHAYNEARQVLLQALQPLGTDYCAVLQRGLISERWVDVYEAKGKRSGAYSSGCYASHPYILMNYHQESLTDVFTLAHEAGHSMHSYFSWKNQSYQDSSYSIFVAEVASTFNEQLLNAHLLNRYNDDPAVLSYLINQQIDDIKTTLFRQTMFAEFEYIIHARADAGESLTTDVYRQIYRSLLEKYFGPAVAIHEIDTVEFLRIPHFYNSFYVYKYATGLAAAISLADDVLQKKPGAQERYLSFLCSGSTKPPLELLQDAGVDMTSPAPLQRALEVFGKLVERLEGLV